ncbi:MAG: hypothetical protein KF696_15975 [Planctomycetes bacterium]|nr:hypothetical protein [Planctomycetota bacterium]MCW8136922.1 hypothetical protein [Planctomycetota bacterium]
MDNAANKQRHTGDETFKRAYRAQVDGLRRVAELQFAEARAMSPEQRLAEALRLSSQFSPPLLTRYEDWVDLVVCERWSKFGKATHAKAAS